MLTFYLNPEAVESCSDEEMDFLLHLTITGEVQILSTTRLQGPDDPLREVQLLEEFDYLTGYVAGSMN